MPLRRNDAGFTLAELCIVIAFISILLSFSLPAFSSAFGHYQLETASEELSSCLIYARTCAVIERCRYKLILVEGKNRFALFRFENGLFVPVKGKWLSGRSLPEGVGLSSDISEIFFYPNGTVSAAGITLNHKNGKELKIVLDGITGLPGLIDPKAGNEPN